MGKDFFVKDLELRQNSETMELLELIQEPMEIVNADLDIINNQNRIRLLFLKELSLLNRTNNR